MTSTVTTRVLATSAFLALGLGTILSGCGSQAAQPAAAAPGPTVTVTAPPHTTAAPPPPARKAPAAPARTVIIQQPAPQQPAPAAPALRYVGNGVFANASTSDAFALNVAASYPGGPGVAYVYSPVTGQGYVMTYQVVGAGTVIATGGNNAYVQF